MVHLHICNRDSAIATCDSTDHNSSDKLQQQHHIIRTRRRKQNHLTFSSTSNCCTTTTATSTTTTTNHLRRFSFSEISTATENFSPSTLLGKGSHGAVYSALLNNGTLLTAVKRSTHSSPPQQSKSKSKSKLSTAAENEMKILSSFHYKHFVNLLGYTIDPTTSNIILVFEHMPNGSLYNLLHTNRKSPPGWVTRIQFALQIAKATRYLHNSTPPIFHRDIKSSNILLDSSFHARLSDFSLAVRGTTDLYSTTTIPPAGTLGYIDPSYLSPNDLTTKTDVFSFGILLLEIISGRRAMDFDYSPPSVVDWAIPLIKEGREMEVCDVRISRKCGGDGIGIRMLAVLAVKCVRLEAVKRPGMDEVVSVIQSVLNRIKSPVLCEVRRRVRVDRSSKTSFSRLDLFDDHDDGDHIDQKKKLPVTISRATRPTSTITVSSSSRRKVSSVPGCGGIGIKLETTRRGGSVDSSSRVVIITKSRSVGSSCRIGGNNNNDGVVGLVNELNTAAAAAAITSHRQRVHFAVRLAATVKFSKSRSTGGGLLLRGSKINSILPQQEQVKKKKKGQSNLLTLLEAGVPTTTTEEEEKEHKEQEQKNQNQNLIDSKSNQLCVKNNNITPPTTIVML